METQKNPTTQPIRVKRSIKFAVKDREHHALHLKCFKHYCLNTVGYHKKDWPYLRKIFCHTITPKNIRQYLNVPAKLIHKGIQEDNLESYSNNQPL